MIDELFLTKAVTCKRPKFQHFDKDGFDLTAFEALCYETNGFPVESAGRLACRRDWITSVKGARVDHSYICVRFGFKGELAEQIEKLALQYKMPQMRKLLQIRPKLGIDINLEYVRDDGQVLDLFHYEEDFVDTDPRPRIAVIENLVRETDWHKIACELDATRDRWAHLTGDDENDYKARLVGLDRAYRTYKVL